MSGIPAAAYQLDENEWNDTISRRLDSLSRLSDADAKMFLIKIARLYYTNVSAFHGHRDLETNVNIGSLLSEAAQRSLNSSASSRASE